MDATDKSKLRPMDWLAPGQEWVTGEQARFQHRGTWVVEESVTYKGGTLLPDAPPEVHLVQAISVGLCQALDGKELAREHLGTDDKPWSLRRLARDTGLSTRAVFDLKHGKSWPNLQTVARLEMALDTPLWGSAHRDEHQKRRNHPADNPPSPSSD